MCELIQIRKLQTSYIQEKTLIIITHDFAYVALKSEKL